MHCIPVSLFKFDINGILKTLPVLWPEHIVNAVSRPNNRLLWLTALFGDDFTTGCAVAIEIP